MRAFPFESTTPNYFKTILALLTTQQRQGSGARAAHARGFLLAFEFLLSFLSSAVMISLCTIAHAHVAVRSKIFLFTPGDNFRDNMTRKFETIRFEIE